MGTLKIQTQCAKDMLDALDTRVGTTGAWALYTGAPNADPDAVPAGTLLKWGKLNATAAFGAAAESGEGDATEVTVITLNEEQGSQTHVNAGTAGTLAIFRSNTDTNGDTTPTALTNANLVLAGDVAASGAWCTMSNTTITTADVDLTQASCTLTLANTQTV